MALVYLLRLFRNNSSESSFVRPLENFCIARAQATE